MTGHKRPENGAGEPAAMATRSGVDRSKIRILPTRLPIRGTLTHPSIQVM